MKYKTFYESEIRRAGWYYFTPKNPHQFERPKFVEVSQETIDEKWLRCKRYEGWYVGPVNMEEFKIEKKEK